MLDLGFSYKTVVRNSEKVEWRLDEIFPEGTRLDFDRTFLPPALVPTHSLSFLSPAQHRMLNQITSNAYVNVFAFVEEYIIAMALRHAHAEMFGDHDAIRALARFADEEVKHQALFLRYRAAFERDFGHECDVLGSAAEVAAMILGKSPIAVLLVTLHLELITQDHYTDSVKDNEVVDPIFARLLKAHWLEESQHARIDQLELEKVASASTPAAIRQGIHEYAELLGALDDLLASQSTMDAVTLERAIGTSLAADQKLDLVRVQHRNYRRVFLVAGLTHKLFVETISRLDVTAEARVRELTAHYA
jgi:hypothetical protein